MGNKLSPQGYNITRDPVNTNPFWEDGGGNVPAGGTAGQVLTKRTDADFDTEWKTPKAGGSGLPEGGVDGDLLTKVNGEAEWATPDFATGAEVKAATEAAAAATKAAEAASEAVAAERRRAEAVEDNIIYGKSILAEELAEYKQTTNGTIAQLRAADSAEATARENADTALGGRIDDVAGDLAAYKQSTDATLQNLGTADTRLETAIGNEATARLDADALLREDLTEAVQDEAAAREAADNEIRQQIAEMSGIPAGGTTGQALVKASDTNFDVAWGNAGGGVDYPIFGISQAEQSDVNLGDETQLINYSWPPSMLARFFLGGQIRLSDNKFYINWCERHSRLGFTDESLFSLAHNVLCYITSGYDYESRHYDFKPVWGPTLDGNAPAAGCLMVTKARSDAADASTVVITDPVLGGTKGQALVKASSNNYDWEWGDVADADDIAAAIADANTPTVLQRASGNLTGVCAVPWIYVDPDGTVHGGTTAADIPSNWLTNFNNTGVSRLLWRTWQPNGTIILHPESGNVYVPVKTALSPDNALAYTIPAAKAASGTIMIVNVAIKAKCGVYEADGVLDFVLTGDEIVCKTGHFRVHDATSYYDHAGMGDFVVEASRAQNNLLVINYGIMADFFNYAYALFPDLANSGYSWSITPTVTVGFALPNT